MAVRGIVDCDWKCPSISTISSLKYSTAEHAKCLLDHHQLDHSKTVVLFLINVQQMFYVSHVRCCYCLFKCLSMLESFTHSLELYCDYGHSYVCSGKKQLLTLCFSSSDPSVSKLISVYNFTSLPLSVFGIQPTQAKHPYQTLWMADINPIHPIRMSWM